MDIFLNQWESEEFIIFDGVALELLNLNSQQFNFLTEIGLPKESAPFLSFRNDLNSINTIYELQNSNYNSKIMIGSDGAGDPICLEITNKHIYACDHEDDFEPYFMNTGVIELFKFLSLFREFGGQLIEKRGEYAFIDSDFTDDELFELTTKMKLIDPSALERSTFWSYEIDTIKANREYYKNENKGDNIR
ncbi:MAG: SUKH-4 family immunity protein [Cyclobacteriaceae bacterium]